VELIGKQVSGSRVTSHNGNRQDNERVTLSTMYSSVVDDELKASSESFDRVFAWRLEPHTSRLVD
jgi:hypothetical protein